MIIKPELSVIIPVYKVENYLERCVRSVLNQDYKDLEIILVDDGSPDRCPEICDSLASEDNRIIVIHKENGGLSSARNKGIEVSKGKYLAFLDSDDQWANSQLKNVMSHLKRDDVDMLVFDSIDILPNGIQHKRNDYGFFENEYVILNRESYYSKIMETQDFRESACTKFISRDFVFRNNLLFCLGVTGEDSEWMLRLLRVVKRVGVSNIQLFLCTCGRAGSIQNSIRDKNIRDLIGTIAKSIKYYESHSDDLVKKFEMEQCAYLLANATGLLYFIKDKIQKHELKAQLKSRSHLFDYSANSKMSKVKLIYNLFGFDVLSFFLEKYMYLKKH